MEQLCQGTEEKEATGHDTPRSTFHRGLGLAWLCDRPAWLNDTAFLWISVKAGHGLLLTGDLVYRNDVDRFCRPGQIAMTTYSASCKICLQWLHFLCQTCLVERGRILRATFIHIPFQPGDTRLHRPITWNHFASLSLSTLALV